MSKEEKYEKLLMFVKNLVISAEVNSDTSLENIKMKWYLATNYAKFLLNEIEEG